jgi:hypothetical protein
MSALNGDKSRFNRERKKKIARRKRTYALLECTEKAFKLGNAAICSKPSLVSA